MPIEWELSYVDLELLNRHEAGFRRHPQVVRDIAKAPRHPKHVEVSPVEQEFPDWVAVGARMRSMLLGGPGSVTITAIYWVDFLGNPCDDTENEPNHRIIEWYKGGDTGFWSTARDWFHDDWQYSEVEPAPWWDRL